MLFDLLDLKKSHPDTAVV